MDAPKNELTGPNLPMTPTGMVASHVLLFVLVQKRYLPC